MNNLLDLPAVEISASVFAWNRAFQIAVLLTGDASQAETALFEAIEAGDLSDEGILRASITAALTPRTGSAATPQPPALPPELQRVVQLPTGSRHCYVLRILAGVSREGCSRLLGLDARTVDACAGAAARELAQPQCLSAAV